MWLLILVVVATFYVWSPLIFLATHRIPIIPTRRLARGEVPEPVAQAIPAWEAALAGAGFSLFAVHEMALDRAPGYGGAGRTAQVVHLVNRAAAVHGVDYLTPKGRWQVFDTRFANGQEVITSNFAMPETFADPRVHTLRMPRERDLARLYALHLAHVRHVMGPDATGVLPDNRGLLDYVAERERRLLERQRALGVMTSKKDVYRPTLIGAFKTVWAYLPPMRWIRGAQHARLMRTLNAQVPDQGSAA
ncbi:MAG TPA: hypothetical protein VFY65_01540 [Longimicrobium sp.]|nr:hypothetical protein [Longimicrobium sp.]